MKNILLLIFLMITSPLYGLPPEEEQDFNLDYENTEVMFEPSPALLEKRNEEEELTHLFQNMWDYIKRPNNYQFFMYIWNNYFPEISKTIDATWMQNFHKPHLGLFWEQENPTWKDTPFSLAIEKKEKRPFNCRIHYNDPPMAPYGEKTAYGSLEDFEKQFREGSFVHFKGEKSLVVLFYSHSLIIKNAVKESFDSLKEFKKRIEKDDRIHDFDKKYLDSVLNEFYTKFFKILEKYPASMSASGDA